MRWQFRLPVRLNFCYLNCELNTSGTGSPEGDGNLTLYCDVKQCVLEIHLDLEFYVRFVLSKTSTCINPMYGIVHISFIFQFLCHLGVCPYCGNRREIVTKQLYLEFVVLHCQGKGVYTVMKKKNYI